MLLNSSISVWHVNMGSLQEPEEEKEMASVPVDDEQPRCALSGEKFEKFWHDDHQVHCSAMHSFLVYGLMANRLL